MVELNKVSNMCLFYIWESWFSVFFIVFSSIESLMLVQIIVLQIMVQ